jgi:DUF2914 family protein
MKSTTMLASSENNFSQLFSAFKRNEHRLSAAAMAAGFGFDNYYFDRVDHPATQIALLGYLVSAIGSILLIHFTEARPEAPALLKRSHPLLVVATQFAFGGLWSAFLILYGRSALTAASWPFVIVLAAMMLANEIFRQHHSRLAFTCTLLFLALFSYTIMAVPVFVGSMGPLIFALSGMLTVAVFVLVLKALNRIGRERIERAQVGIALGAAGVFLTVNIFYFTNILPPLPLTLAHAGIFHAVTKNGDTYRAIAERQSFPWFGVASMTPVMRVEPGASLSAYSAVFAPIQLKTNIVHIWRRYDEVAQRWRTESTVAFRIVGGREGGYRGYSIRSRPASGRWRVDIETPEGALIGRLAFLVEPGSADGRTEQILN